MHDVDVESKSPTVEEAPFSIPKFTDIIAKYVDKEFETGTLDDGLNTAILTELQTLTSKYKFLVQSTQVHPAGCEAGAFDIVAKFGAVWDQEKDGYVCFRVVPQTSEDKEAMVNVTLLTIYWLYVG